MKNESGKKVVPVKNGIGIHAQIMLVISLITLTTIGIVVSSLIILKNQGADAVIINIAGRQRMLSQKMTKEVLSISGNLDVEANRQALAKTYQLFQKSHQGLLKGDAAMGLPPTTDKTVLSQMEIVNSLWEKFSPNIQVVLQKDGSDKEFKEAIGNLLSSNIPLLKEMNKAVGLYEQFAQRKIGFLRNLLISGVFLSVIVTYLCWLMISSRIVKPIHKVVKMIQEMEKGHQVARLAMHNADEIGQMANAMDDFADNLEHEVVFGLQKLADGDLTFDVTPKDDRDILGNALKKTIDDLNRMVGQALASTDQISIGSNEVSNASEALSQGATEQAAALEQISASMTEMAAQTQNNAKNATLASTLARESRDTAEVGNKQMQNMVVAMGEIDDSSQNISQIIKVIDEIAFQTNLLALNAAVEAARAGRHGKGFAVVAEEVRNLAGRSAKAAKETAELIEGSVQKTKSGAELAQQTAKSLDLIVDAVNKVTDLIADIAKASHEQAEGITQVTEGLDQIDQVTQQNMACAEEGAAATQQLSSQALYLKSLMDNFTVKKGTVHQGGLVQIGE